MAGYNEILAGRFNRFVQKLLSMKGPAAMNEVGSVLTPSLSVFSGVENRYLESWNRFSIAFQVGASAANNSIFRMRNLTASGVITVIEKIFIWNANAAVQDVRLEGWTLAVSTALGTDLVGTATRLDARQISDSAMNLSIQNTAPLAALGRTLWFAPSLPSNSGVDLIADDDQELTLLPGDTAQIRVSTVNSSLNAILWWRERILEDSEVR